MHALVKIAQPPHSGKFHMAYNNAIMMIANHDFNMDECNV